MEPKSPPVHLHIREDAPVHVHMTRSGKKQEERSSEAAAECVKRKSRADRHNRSRSLSERLPWIPAPALTSKMTSPRRAMLLDKEIELLPSEAASKQKEQDTDDELWAKAKNRAYEKRLDGLMGEVGSLKTEVDLQRTLRESERKDRALDESLRAVERQEAELVQAQKDLHEKEYENRLLRDVVTTLKDSSLTASQPRNRSESVRGSATRERLLRRLVEAELDGQAAAEQALLLRDVAQSLLCSGIPTASRSSGSALRPLEQHRDLLVQKLCDFDEANRKLRELLRQCHGDEAELIRLEEQRNLLVEKLTLADEENEKLRSKIKDCEKKIGDLATDLEQQELVARNATAELQQTSIRTQVEADTRDAELQRLAERTSRAEQDAALLKEEVVRLQQLLVAASEKYRRDKDALKRAARMSKQQATVKDDAMKALESRLDDITGRLEEAQKARDTLQLKVDCLAFEKSDLSMKNADMKSRLTELEAHVGKLTESHREKQEAMASDLRLRTSDLASFRAENDRLKMTITTLESKVDSADVQCRSLRTDLRQAEATSDDLKQQLSRARLANEDANARLHEAELTIERLRNEGHMELNRVRLRLESRLAELEPLPELLKASELRLSAANERLSIFDKQSSETMALLKELTSKAEKQSLELSSWKERYQTLDASTQARLSQLQSKLSDAETTHVELLAAAARRDEALAQANQKLERSTQDCANLARQLEQLRADWRKAQDEAAERASLKEKALQEQVRQEQEQLCSTRTELARVRRDKEEADRRLNARIFDLKERLEQSHSSNRSMQNYVHFLKSSYASVFGDASLGAGNGYSPPGPAAGSASATAGFRPGTNREGRQNRKF